MLNSVAGSLRKIKKRRLLVISAGGKEGGIQCLYFSINGDTWEIISHTSNPYPQKITQILTSVFSETPEKITFTDFIQLDHSFTTYFTDIARTTLSRLPTALRKPHAILLLKPNLVKTMPTETEELTSWNVSLGDAQHCASALKTPVLTDFIRHQYFCGGNGNFPTHYGNLRIASTTGGIVVFVNIGLVAHLTIVDTRGASILIDSDSGPGTCCINTLMRRYQHQKAESESFDRDGTLAAEGEVNGECLKIMSNDDWFKTPGPKTANPDNFNQLLDSSTFTALSIPDQFATVTALTARTIYDFFRTGLPSEDSDISVFISGGGSHNQTLHRYLQTYFDTIKVQTIDELGIPSDMRIPLAFGLTINGWLRGESIDWKNNPESPVTAPGKWVMP